MENYRYKMFQGISGSERKREQEKEENA